MAKNNRKGSDATTTMARVLAVCCAVSLISMAPGLVQSVQAAPQGTGSDGAENVRLVGYNDLQGRQALSQREREIQRDPCS